MANPENNYNNWLIASDATVKHICIRQKKKHKRNCAHFPSDVEMAVDKTKKPLYLRCLCCDSARRIETFPEEIRNRIIKIYSKN